MRTLVTMTAVVYAFVSYSFGGATMTQGLGGSGRECRAGTRRVSGRSSWSKIVPLLKDKGFTSRLRATPDVIC